MELRFLGTARLLLILWVLLLLLVHPSYSSFMPFKSARSREQKSFFYRDASSARKCGNRTSKEELQFMFSEMIRRELWTNAGSGFSQINDFLDTVAFECIDDFVLDANNMPPTVADIRVDIPLPSIVSWLASTNQQRLGDLLNNGKFGFHGVRCRNVAVQDLQFYLEGDTASLKTGTLYIQRLGIDCEMLIEYTEVNTEVQVCASFNTCPWCCTNGGWGCICNGPCHPCVDLDFSFPSGWLYVRFNSLDGTGFLATPYSNDAPIVTLKWRSQAFGNNFNTGVPRNVDFTTATIASHSNFNNDLIIEEANNGHCTTFMEDREVEIIPGNTNRCPTTNDGSIISNLRNLLSLIEDEIPFIVEQIILEIGIDKDGVDGFLSESVQSIKTSLDTVGVYENVIYATAEAAVESRLTARLGSSSWDNPAQTLHLSGDRIVDTGSAVLNSVLGGTDLGINDVFSNLMASSGGLTPSPTVPDAFEISPDYSGDFGQALKDVFGYTDLIAETQMTVNKVTLGGFTQFTAFELASNALGLDYTLEHAFAMDEFRVIMDLTAVLTPGGCVDPARTVGYAGLTQTLDFTIDVVLDDLSLTDVATTFMLKHNEFKLLRVGQLVDANAGSYPVSGCLAGVFHAFNVTSLRFSVADIQSATLSNFFDNAFGTLMNNIVFIFNRLYRATFPSQLAGIVQEFALPPMNEFFWQSIISPEPCLAYNPDAATRNTIVDLQANGIMSSIDSAINVGLAGTNGGGQLLMNEAIGDATEFLGFARGEIIDLITVLDETAVAGDPFIDVAFIDNVGSIRLRSVSLFNLDSVVSFEVFKVTSPSDLRNFLVLSPASRKVTVEFLLDLTLDPVSAQGGTSTSAVSETLRFQLDITDFELYTDLVINMNLAKVNSLRFEHFLFLACLLEGVGSVVPVIPTGRKALSLSAFDLRILNAGSATPFSSTSTADIVTAFETFAVSGVGAASPLYIAVFNQLMSNFATAFIDRVLEFNAPTTFPVNDACKTTESPLVTAFNSFFQSGSFDLTAFNDEITNPPAVVNPVVADAPFDGLAFDFINDQTFISRLQTVINDVLGAPTKLTPPDPFHTVGGVYANDVLKIIAENGNAFVQEFVSKNDLTGEITLRLPLGKLLFNGNLLLDDVTITLNELEIDNVNSIKAFKLAEPVSRYTTDTTVSFEQARFVLNMTVDVPKESIDDFSTDVSQDVIVAVDVTDLDVGLTVLSAFEYATFELLKLSDLVGDDIVGCLASAVFQDGLQILNFTFLFSSLDVSSIELSGEMFSQEGGEVVKELIQATLDLYTAKLPNVAQGPMRTAFNTYASDISQGVPDINKCTRPVLTPSTDYIDFQTSETFQALVDFVSNTLNDPGNDFSINKVVELILENVDGGLPPGAFQSTQPIFTFDDGGSTTVEIRIDGLQLGGLNTFGNIGLVDTAQYQFRTDLLAGASPQSLTVDVDILLKDDNVLQGGAPLNNEVTVSVAVQDFTTLIEIFFQATAQSLMDLEIGQAGKLACILAKIEDTSIVQALSSVATVAFAVGCGPSDPAVTGPGCSSVKIPPLSAKLKTTETSTVVFNMVNAVLENAMNQLTQLVEDVKNEAVDLATCKTAPNPLSTVISAITGSATPNITELLDRYTDPVVPTPAATVFEADVVTAGTILCLTNIDPRCDVGAPLADIFPNVQTVFAEVLSATSSEPPYVGQPLVNEVVDLVYNYSRDPSSAFFDLLNDKLYLADNGDVAFELSDVATTVYEDSSLIPGFNVVLNYLALEGLNRFESFNALALEPGASFTTRHQFSFSHLLVMLNVTVSVDGAFFGQTPGTTLSDDVFFSLDMLDLDVDISTLFAMSSETFRAQVLGSFVQNSIDCLLSAMETNGAVITSFIPQVGSLIGPDIRIGADSLFLPELVEAVEETLIALKESFKDELVLAIPNIGQNITRPFMNEVLANATSTAVCPATFVSYGATTQFDFINSPLAKSAYEAASILSGETVSSGFDINSIIEVVVDSLEGPSGSPVPGTYRLPGAILEINEDGKVFNIDNLEVARLNTVDVLRLEGTSATSFLFELLMAVPPDTLELTVDLLIDDTLNELGRSPRYANDVKFNVTVSSFRTLLEMLMQINIDNFLSMTMNDLTSLACILARIDVVQVLQEALSVQAIQVRMDCRSCSSQRFIDLSTYFASTATTTTVLDITNAMLDKIMDQFKSFVDEVNAQTINTANCLTASNPLQDAFNALLGSTQVTNLTALIEEYTQPPLPADDYLALEALVNNSASSVCINNTGSPQCREDHIITRNFGALADLVNDVFGPPSLKVNDLLASVASYADTPGNVVFERLNGVIGTVGGEVYVDLDLDALVLYNDSSLVPGLAVYADRLVLSKLNTLSALDVMKVEPGASFTSRHSATFAEFSADLSFTIEADSDFLGLGPGKTRESFSLEVNATGLAVELSTLIAMDADAFDALVLHNLFNTSELLDCLLNTVVANGLTIPSLAASVVDITSVALEETSTGATLIGEPIVRVIEELVQVASELYENEIKLAVEYIASADARTMINEKLVERVASPGFCTAASSLPTTPDIVDFLAVDGAFDAVQFVVNDVLNDLAGDFNVNSVLQALEDPGGFIPTLSGLALLDVNNLDRVLLVDNLRLEMTTPTPVTKILLTETTSSSALFELDATGFAVVVDVLVADQTVAPFQQGGSDFRNDVTLTMDITALVTDLPFAALVDYNKLAALRLGEITSASCILSSFNMLDLLPTGAISVGDVDVGVDCTSGCTGPQLAAFAASFVPTATSALIPYFSNEAFVEVYTALDELIAEVDANPGTCGSEINPFTEAFDRLFASTLNDLYNNYTGPAPPLASPDAAEQAVVVPPTAQTFDFSSPDLDPFYDELGALFTPSFVEQLADGRISAVEDNFPGLLSWDVDKAVLDLTDYVDPIVLTLFGGYINLTVSNVRLEGVDNLQSVLLQSAGTLGYTLRADVQTSANIVTKLDLTVAIAADIEPDGVAHETLSIETSLGGLSLSVLTLLAIDTDEFLKLTVGGVTGSNRFDCFAAALHENGIALPGLSLSLTSITNLVITMTNNHVSAEVAAVVEELAVAGLAIFQQEVVEAVQIIAATDALDEINANLFPPSLTAGGADASRCPLPVDSPTVIDFTTDAAVQFVVSFIEDVLNDPLVDFSASDLFTLLVDALGGSSIQGEWSFGDLVLFEYVDGGFRFTVDQLVVGGLETVQSVSMVVDDANTLSVRLAFQTPYVYVNTVAKDTGFNAFQQNGLDLDNTFSVGSILNDLEMNLTLTADATYGAIERLELRQLTYLACLIAAVDTVALDDIGLRFSGVNGDIDCVACTSTAVFGASKAFATPRETRNGCACLKEWSEFNDVTSTVLQFTDYCYVPGDVIQGRAEPWCIVGSAICEGSTFGFCNDDVPGPRTTPVVQDFVDVLLPELTTVVADLSALDLSLAACETAENPIFTAVGNNARLGNLTALLNRTASVPIVPESTEEFESRVVVSGPSAICLNVESVCNSLIPFESVQTLANDILATDNEINNILDELADSETGYEFVDRINIDGEIKLVVFLENLNAVVFEDDNIIPGLKVSVANASLIDLDTFTSLSLLTPEGNANFTTSHSFDIDSILVRANVSIEADGSYFGETGTLSSFLEVEVHVSQLAIAVSTLTAFDLTFIEEIAIRSFQDENALDCVLKSVYTNGFVLTSLTGSIAALTGLKITDKSETIPAQQRLISTDAVPFLAETADLFLVKFQSDVLQFIPNLFQGKIREDLNAFFAERKAEDRCPSYLAVRAIPANQAPLELTFAGNTAPRIMSFVNDPDLDLDTLNSVITKFLPDVTRSGTIFEYASGTQRLAMEDITISGLDSLNDVHLNFTEVTQFMLDPVQLGDLVPPLGTDNPLQLAFDVVISDSAIQQGAGTLLNRLRVVARVYDISVVTEILLSLDYNRFLNLRVREVQEIPCIVAALRDLLILSVSSVGLNGIDVSASCVSCTSSAFNALNLNYITVTQFAQLSSALAEAFVPDFVPPLSQGLSDAVTALNDITNCEAQTVTLSFTPNNVLDIDGIIANITKDPIVPPPFSVFEAAVIVPSGRQSVCLAEESVDCGSGFATIPFYDTVVSTLNELLGPAEFKVNGFIEEFASLVVEPGSDLVTFSEFISIDLSNVVTLTVPVNAAVFKSSEIVPDFEIGLNAVHIRNVNSFNRFNILDRPSGAVYSTEHELGFDELNVTIEIFVKGNAAFFDMPGDAAGQITQTFEVEVDLIDVSIDVTTLLAIDPEKFQQGTVRGYFEANASDCWFSTLHANGAALPSLLVDIAAIRNLVFTTSGPQAFVDNTVVDVLEELGQIVLEEYQSNVLKAVKNIAQGDGRETINERMAEYILEVADGGNCPSPSEVVAANPPGTDFVLGDSRGLKALFDLLNDPVNGIDVNQVLTSVLGPEGRFSRSTPVFQLDLDGRVFIIDNFFIQGLNTVEEIKYYTTGNYSFQTDFEMAQNQTAVVASVRIFQADQSLPISGRLQQEGQDLLNNVTLNAFAFNITAFLEFLVQGDLNQVLNLQVQQLLSLSCVMAAFSNIELLKGDVFVDTIGFTLKCNPCSSLALPAFGAELEQAESLDFSKRVTNNFFDQGLAKLGEIVKEASGISTKPQCIEDAATWVPLQGHSCSTYEPGVFLSNFPQCDSHCDINSICAAQVCSECGQCQSDLNCQDVTNPFTEAFGIVFAAADLPSINLTALIAERTQLPPTPTDASIVENNVFIPPGAAALCLTSTSVPECANNAFDAILDIYQVLNDVANSVLGTAGDDGVLRINQVVEDFAQAAETNVLLSFLAPFLSFNAELDSVDLYLPMNLTLYEDDDFIPGLTVILTDLTLHNLNTFTVFSVLNELPDAAFTTQHLLSWSDLDIEADLIVQIDADFLLGPTEAGNVLEEIVHVEINTTNVTVDVQTLLALDPNVLGDLILDNLFSDFVVECLLSSVHEEGINFPSLLVYADRVIGPEITMSGGILSEKLVDVVEEAVVVIVTFYQEEILDSFPYTFQETVRPFLNEIMRNSTFDGADISKCPVNATLPSGTDYLDFQTSEVVQSLLDFIDETLMNPASTFNINTVIEILIDNDEGTYIYGSPLLDLNTDDRIFLIDGLIAKGLNTVTNLSLTPTGAFQIEFDAFLSGPIEITIDFYQEDKSSTDVIQQGGRALENNVRLVATVGSLDVFLDNLIQLDLNKFLALPLRKVASISCLVSALDLARVDRALLSVLSVDLQLTCLTTAQGAQGTLGGCTSTALPALGVRLTDPASDAVALKMTNFVLENVMKTFQDVVDELNSVDVSTGECETFENPFVTAFGTVQSSSVPNVTALVDEYTQPITRLSSVDAETNVALNASSAGIYCLTVTPGASALPCAQFVNDAFDFAAALASDVLSSESNGKVRANDVLELAVNLSSQPDSIFSALSGLFFFDGDKVALAVDVDEQVYADDRLVPGLSVNVTRVEIRGLNSITAMDVLNLILDTAASTANAITFGELDLSVDVAVGFDGGFIDDANIGTYQVESFTFDFVINDVAVDADLLIAIDRDLMALQTPRNLLNNPVTCGYTAVPTNGINVNSLSVVAQSVTGPTLNVKGDVLAVEVTNVLEESLQALSAFYKVEILQAITFISQNDVRELVNERLETLRKPEDESDLLCPSVAAQLALYPEVVYHNFESSQIVQGLLFIVDELLNDPDGDFNINSVIESLTAAAGTGAVAGEFELGSPLFELLNNGKDLIVDQFKVSNLNTVKDLSVVLTGNHSILGDSTLGALPDSITFSVRVILRDSTGTVLQNGTNMNNEFTVSATVTNFRILLELLLLLDENAFLSTPVGDLDSVACLLNAFDRISMLQGLALVNSVDFSLSCTVCTSAALVALGEELDLPETGTRGLSMTNEALRNAIQVLDSLLNESTVADTASCSTADNPFTSNFGGLPQFQGFPNLTELVDNLTLPPGELDLGDEAEAAVIVPEGLEVFVFDASQEFKAVADGFNSFLKETDEFGVPRVNDLVLKFVEQINSTNALSALDPFLGVRDGLVSAFVPLNRVIYQSDEIIPGLNFTIDTVEINGLNSLKVIDVLNIIGDFTLLHYLEYSLMRIYITGQIQIEAGFLGETPADALLKEAFVLDISLADLALNFTTTLAADPVTSLDMTLGAILSDNAVNCFTSLFHENGINIPGIATEVTGGIAGPNLVFTESDIFSDAMAAVVDEFARAIFQLYEQEFREAVPNIADDILRPLFNQEFDTYTAGGADQNKCPEVLVEVDPVLLDDKYEVLGTNDLFIALKDFVNNVLADVDSGFSMNDLFRLGVSITDGDDSTPDVWDFAPAIWSFQQSPTKFIQIDQLQVSGWNTVFDAFLQDTSDFTADASVSLAASNPLIISIHTAIRNDAYDQAFTFELEMDDINVLINLLLQIDVDRVKAITLGDLSLVCPSQTAIELVGQFVSDAAVSLVEARANLKCTKVPCNSATLILLAGTLPGETPLITSAMNEILSAAIKTFFTVEETGETEEVDCIPADFEIWISGGFTTFYDEMDACKAAGAVQDIRQCVRQSTNYNGECTTCMAEYVDCVITACPSECAGVVAMSEQSCRSSECLTTSGCIATFGTCSGLSPNSVLPLVSYDSQVCNAADRDEFALNGEAAFVEDMESCGVFCFVSTQSNPSEYADCVSSCIQSKRGYTDACSDCHGATAQCTREQCLTECQGGRTPSCINCVEAACNEGFEICSGFSLQNIEDGYSTDPNAEQEWLALAAITAAAAEASTNQACAGPTDLAIWDVDKGLGFSQDVFSCALPVIVDGLFDPDACFVGKRGYSAPCASCFNTLATSCMIAQCFTSCLASATGPTLEYECELCLGKECYPSFATCSGVDPFESSARLQVVDEVVCGSFLPSIDAVIDSSVEVAESVDPRDMERLVKVPTFARVFDFAQSDVFSFLQGSIDAPTVNGILEIFSNGSAEDGGIQEFVKMDEDGLVSTKLPLDSIVYNSSEYVPGMVVRIVSVTLIGLNTLTEAAVLQVISQYTLHHVVKAGFIGVVVEGQIDIDGAVFDSTEPTLTEDFIVEMNFTDVDFEIDTLIAMNPEEFGDVMVGSLFTDKAFNCLAFGIHPNGAAIPNLFMNVSSIVGPVLSLSSTGVTSIAAGLFLEELVQEIFGVYSEKMVADLPGFASNFVKNTVNSFLSSFVSISRAACAEYIPPVNTNSRYFDYLTDPTVEQIRFFLNDVIGVDGNININVFGGMLTDANDYVTFSDVFNFSLSLQDLQLPTDQTGSFSFRLKRLGFKGIDQVYDMNVVQPTGKFSFLNALGFGVNDTSRRRLGIDDVDEPVAFNMIVEISSIDLIQGDPDFSDTFDITIGLQVLYLLLDLVAQLNLDEGAQMPIENLFNPFLLRLAARLPRRPRLGLHHRRL